MFFFFRKRYLYLGFFLGLGCSFSLDRMALGEEIDLKQSPTYQRFFAEHSSEKRARAKHAKSLTPVAEHFGVAGHRRRQPVDPEDPHNAEAVIGRKTLGEFIAGTNAQAALAYSTPGASFSASDPMGTNAKTSTFYLRGFDISQLGVTMDGIPMGNQGFGSADGANVSELLIQENIHSLSASQGAGGVDVPASTTLGGTLTYTTLDPSEKFGVDIGQEFGSFSGYRTFGRLNSGRLNPTGTKFMASFLRNQSNMWTGGGFQREEAMNFKLVQPISNFGKITLTSDWSDSPQYNLPGNTKHMLGSLGYGDHNFYPDYGQAKKWAANCHSGSTAGLPPGVTAQDACNLSYQSSQLERVYLEGLKAEFQISPAVKSSSLVYGQVTDNWTGSTNSGFSTPGNGPGYPVDMADLDDHFKGRRLGVTQNFDVQLGHRNHLKTGIWYENNRYHDPSFFGPFGPNQPINNVFNLSNSGEVTAMSTQFTTNTFQFYVEDGFQMAKNMTFTYGFKSLVQSTNGGMTYRAPSEVLSSWGLGPNSLRPAYGRLTGSNAFLPHFNYDWKFLPQHEFYFDVAENMRPIDPGNTAWSYGLGNSSSLASGQAQFNEEKKNLRPERSWNYVVGYRYKGKSLDFGIDYYHTDYIGRLGQVTTGSSVNVGVSQYLADLGGEKMDGMDLVGIAHLDHVLRFPDYMGKLDFTNSFSYDHAVYENSAVPTANGPVSIKGVQQVYYPRYMYKTNVHYNNGRLGFDLNVNYNSARNVTYTGDVKVPGYWTSELTASYLLGRKGKEGNFKLDFGVTNLFGQHYVGGISGQTSLQGTPDNDNGGNNNLYWAAPREFFGTVSVVF
ncbi:TonB-dependent receptor [Acetobacteraceae bacterium]|nr:TonB-dependent receptor [Acetobacteraceae bacterium]